MLFDVYLCMAFRCSNMELGPIMSGKYKCEKMSLPPPPSGSLSGCHLVIFISESGNLTDIYDANHRLQLWATLSLQITHAFAWAAVTLCCNCLIIHRYFSV